MAIYVFDGTGQLDSNVERPDPTDTNVARFLQCTGADDIEAFYKAGVGTRFGRPGKVIGGIFGAGARSRLAKMFENLEEVFMSGDEQIAIVGYSRGAAMALHFANMINEATIQNQRGEMTTAPPIQYLGLFDAVASFGLSFTIGPLVDFQAINLGWNLTVPPNVESCRHALAFDERRETFRPTRLNADHTNASITEVWFKGDHGDIGGGNQNDGLSNISLAWILEGAKAAGVEVDDAKLASVRAGQDPSAAPKLSSLDPVQDPYRETLPGDQFDANQWSLLKLNESRSVEVLAGARYTDTGILIKKGNQYVFSFDGEWRDGDITCSGEGWTLADVRKGPLELVMKVTQPMRRVKDAKWFELIGSLGRSNRDQIRIGNGQYSSEETPFVATSTDALFLYPNDLMHMYWNNRGAISVTITRTG